MKGHLLNRLRIEINNGRLNACLYSDNYDEAESIAEYSNCVCEMSEVSGGDILSGTDYKYCVKSRITWA